MFIKSTDEISLKLMGILQEIKNISCDGSSCGKCFLGRESTRLDISVCEMMDSSHYILLREIQKEGEK